MPAQRQWPWAGTRFSPAAPQADPDERVGVCQAHLRAVRRGRQNRRATPSGVFGTSVRNAVVSCLRDSTD